MQVSVWASCLARLAQVARADKPVQGWEQWSADINQLVSSYETAEALERVPGSNKALLRPAREGVSSLPASAPSRGTLAAG